MAINSIADIVARSPWRRVYSFNPGGSVESLESVLRFYLIKLGWSQVSDNSFKSRIVQTRLDNASVPYRQSVQISWTNFLDFELHITIGDEYGTIPNNQFIRLKPSTSICYIFGGPFQFCILSSSGIDSDYSGCLISCLNLPRFSPFLNCVCGFEIGSFLRNYATQDFNYYLGAAVQTDRTVLLNNPIGGAGGQGIITLPSYASKVVVTWSGPFGVKSPAWLSWGIDNTAVPYLKGFLWDMFLWYDNRYDGLLARKVIDSRATLQLANVGSNILSFEYGNVE